MVKQETIHSRESGLRFTQIIIKPVGRMRQAYFRYWFDRPDHLKPLLTTVSAKTAKECVEKIEEFFGTDLEESEYTITERYLGRNVVKKLEFKVEGIFESLYAAKRWCIENGYSYGVLDGNNPIAIWKGKFSISKWHNLSIVEKGSCNGVMMCEREGSAFIYIFN